MDQTFNIRKGSTVCSQPIYPSGFLHQAINQSFSPIIITNRKGIINYANPAFSTLTGYSLEELVGASPALLKSGVHSKNFYKALWDTILSGNQWQSEICNRKKNGELYWEYQSISPIKDESGNITSFLAIRLDDTQRKKYETELKQLTSNLENKNKDILNYAKAIEIANMQLQDFSIQLNKKFEELKESHLETLQCLAMAAEFKDEDTGEHITRMSRYSAILAKKLDYTDDDVENILYAAPMHDIGKLGIPDEIMLKSGKLSSKEFDEIKKHPTIGAKILSSSKSPLLDLAAKISLTHHEKWDGSGYPLGLAGRDIHKAGHIVAIADSFDALTSRRPYKDPYPIEIAKDIIISEKGKSFGPDFVDVFVDSLEEIKDVKSEVDGELALPLSSFELSERDRS